MSERTDAIRQLRERTGAGMMDCKRALEVCGGNVDAAVDGLAAARRWYDGDPRHTCHDLCPPWSFAWVRSPRENHACSTHCPLHPDPRGHSLGLVREVLGLDETTARRVLGICDWNHARAIRFVHEMRQTTERTPR